MQRLLRTYVPAAIAFGALGCSEAAPARDASSTPSVASAPWYRRATSIDLTGDGRADSVRLDAQGTRPDSLRLTLTLLVDGEAEHREEWGSSYELALVDSASGVHARLDEWMRARLDTILASVAVQPLDAPSVRLMAEDSAILAGLTSPPTHRISFSYGYETTARLVWDAPGRRFVRLWSCC